MLLGDGRRKSQLHGTDGEGGERRRLGGCCRKKEGQPFSQGGWPFLFYCHRVCISLKESGREALCMLWQKPRNLVAA
jgi:hypothetical protein